MFPERPGDVCDARAGAAAGSSEEEIRRGLADMLLVEEVAEKVYGPLALMTKEAEVEDGRESGSGHTAGD